MNWSTRLRRWVRIRTPPVREASTKPERGDGLAGAGRVLEPEASAGARVLGRLLDASSSARLLPVLGLLVGSSSSSSSAPSPFASSAPPAPRRHRPRAWPGSPGAAGSVGRGSGGAEFSTSAISAARVPESASTWCSVELGPVRELRRVVGQQPLQPEQQRVAAPPFGRGRLAAGVELLERGLDGAVPGACPARGRRCVSPSSRIGSRANSRTRSSLIACDRPGRARGDVEWFWP